MPVSARFHLVHLAQLARLIGRRAGCARTGSLRRSGLLLPAIAWVAVACPAWAAPIVFIDVDPDTPGIQDVGSVALSESFSVDVSIGGVDGLLPVTGFQLDLDFDGAVLTALSTASGGFLPEPVIPVQDSIAPDRVEFAEVTLSGLGGTGDGVLLRVTFEAQALGTSSLTLGELILAGAFGVPIQPESVSGARITVTDRKDGEPPIPEPGAALVFGAGLTLAAWRLRGRPEPPRSSTASHPFRV